MSNEPNYKPTELARGLLDALKPVRLITVSDWADKYRILTSDSSPEPGPWVTDRAPWLREIMNDLSPNSPVTRVVVVKAVQLGFTESLLNTIGCFIDLDPCSIMYVLPTLELAKYTSNVRIDKMINTTPVLRKKVGTKKERDSGNTMFMKAFPGGSITISGANSASSLSSRPVRVMLLDEVDRMPINVGNEGSPIDLAENRTVNYGSKKKIGIISSPTVEGVSVVQKEYDQTDQRKWMMPAPCCSCEMEFKFQQLRWEPGKPETVYYECEHCGDKIYEHQKTFMLPNGKWVPTAIENIKFDRKGYHLNSLYSALGWLSWADIIKKFEKADEQNSPEAMQVFVNTMLGETFKQQGEAPEWKNLYNRREQYPLNKPCNEVCFITVGADVQRDRIELEVVGWGKGKKTWSIDYRVLFGDTSQIQVWDDLASVIDETWERADGLLLPMKRMAIDTGFRTSEVYAFCRRFDQSRVVPIKGRDEQPVMIATPRNIDVMANGQKAGTIALWNIGVSMIKSELYGWLRIEKTEGLPVPNNYCTFPEYPENYFKGITAEKLTTKVRNGFQKYEWVKHYERNEPLDCRVYARAAAAIVGIDRFKDQHYDQIAGRSISRSSAPAAPPKKRPPGGSIWGRTR